MCYVMNMERRRKITGTKSTLAYQQHEEIPHQSYQQLSELNQFQNRTVSINSTSSVQSDNYG